MKVYHWILLLLAVLIGCFVWVFTGPFMTINAVPVYDGYDSISYYQGIPILLC